MSLPALRQPKCITAPTDVKPKNTIPKCDVQYVIVTLKNSRKLVINSDAYHGIITAGNKYDCLFCRTEMQLDEKYKESHKTSPLHLRALEKYPHIEDFHENLLRKLNKDTYHCTICNVTLESPFIKRHISTESHKYELEKAVMRSTSYKPFK